MAVTVAGCSSKSAPAASSSSPSASQPAGSGTAPAPAASAPASAATPIDPSSVTLQTDTGAENAYVIQVPTSWQAENLPVPGGFGRRYALINNGTRVAQVTVRCERGATVDSLSKADGSVVTSLGGTYAVTPLTDITLAGLQGKQTTYTLGVGGVRQETSVIYLQGKICGWQILLQAFGAGELAHYTPLFEVVMATFKPVIAGG